MARDVFISKAHRSATAPRGGALAGLALHDFAAPVLAEVARVGVESVICGNALYGGGNPARLIALAAGLPESLPALTVDTQCCAGLDALLLAATMVRSGACSAVAAGGAESYSRSAIRLHRPMDKGGAPIAYDRPPFTPWKDRDPDMIEAAAALAELLEITREKQEAWAIRSHAKAVRAKEGLDHFTRALSPALCARLPALAGAAPYAVTAATTAVEADGAAFLRVTAEPSAIRIVDALSAGGDPEMPALAPIAAAKNLLKNNGLGEKDLARVEIMEAFAVQAIAFAEALDLDPTIVNAGGGGLARGHPIGASGAILAVRLVRELEALPEGSLGLAAIAGAGGLASVLLLEKTGL